MSILKKRNIIILSGLILTFLFFHFTYGLFKITEEKISHDFKNHQLYIAKDIGNDISYDFNEISKDINNIFYQQGKINSKSIETIKNIFYKLKPSYIKDIALYNSSGSLMSATNKSHFPDKLSNKIISKGILFNYYVSSIEKNDINKGRGINYFNLIMPVKISENNNLKVQGNPLIWLDYKIEAKNFFELFVNKNYLKKLNLSLWITDGKGDLIFQSEHPGMVDNKSNMKLVKCLKCHEDNSYIKDIKNISEGSFQYSLKDAKDKTASLATINLSGNKWKIIITSPTEDLSRYIKLADSKVILLIASFIALLILISIYFFKIYRSRIKAMEEVKHVTEKNKLLNKVIESEKRYRILFDISPDSIFVHRNGRFLFANPSGIKLLGAKNLKELTEINVLDVVHPDYMDIVIKRIDKVEKRKETLPVINEKFRKMDGTYIDVEVATAPFDIDGETSHLVIARDITERILAETELEKYRKNLESLVKQKTNELTLSNMKLTEEIRREKEIEMILKESLNKEKELNELKTRFISTTSHEFRTPLTTIMSSSELIQRYRKKWSEDKIEVHLERIKATVDYLTNLLDDILTISRTDSGKIHYEPQKTDLCGLCEAIIQQAKIYSNEHHKFIFNYNVKEDIFILDQKLIRFILLNLLSNAFKYSPDGGNVTLEVSESGSNIIFKIRDEGIGIPESDKKYLCQPFHRCSNVEDINGTGLGLSIVKKSVELHSGQFDYESEEGKGTNFTITIPASKENEKENISNRGQ